MTFLSTYISNIGFYTSSLKCLVFDFPSCNEELNDHFRLILSDLGTPKLVK
jgi:hypothetical protein